MESVSPANGIDRGASTPQWLIRVGLCVLAGLLAWNLLDYLFSAREAINFPFELDYGEGIVWQQMRSLLAGDGYGAIDGFPSIVFHYPPLYHFGAALLAALTGMDPLAAGRLLSVSSTIATAGFIAMSVAELTSPPRTRSWISGAIAGLLVLSTAPIQSWSMLMRVDMLSTAFSFAGVYFGLRSLRQPLAIHLAALLFVAAIYTKQTAIAAPAAIFVVLLFLRPRTALAGLGTTLGLGLLALGTLMWLTDGGFLRHVLWYNINRFGSQGFLAILDLIVSHLVFITVAFLSIHRRLHDWPVGFFAPRGWSALRHRLLSSADEAGYAMMLVYLALTTLMLAMATKSGASVNYFIEWSCVIAAFAGLGLVDAVSVATRTSFADKVDVAAILLPPLLAFQVFSHLGIPDNRLSSRAPQRNEFAQLSALVRAARQPVISDNMVVVLRGGKPVVWEPAIFTELTSKGLWNERPFVEKIKAHQFAFFLTDGGPGDQLYDDRYSRSVSQALQTAYPIKRHLAGYTLHFPPGPLPAPATAMR